MSARSSGSLYGSMCAVRHGSVDSPGLFTREDAKAGSSGDKRVGDKRAGDQTSPQPRAPG